MVLPRVESAHGMPLPAVDLLTPRILVVDDERKIHASLRLRLGRDYDLVFCFDALEALKKLQTDRFDLCFADIHMPHMDGLTFIDSARAIDPPLGYVVLSAFDSDSNLRRAIPLQVFDFVSKPLPERHGFEARIPGWIEQTRERRRAHELATQASVMAGDRDTARLERDVEFVASETARDALLQAAGLLTTIQAHLMSAASLLATRARTDPGATHLLRNVEEARKTTDAAVTVVDGFFGSAYGNRDSSPALVNEGVPRAIDIATRMVRSEHANKAIDFCPIDSHVPVHGLSGIEFLLMLVPALGAPLALSAPGTTVGIRGDHVTRLEAVGKDPRYRTCLWLNRRNALNSRAGVVLCVTARAAALSRPQFEAWLKAEYEPLTAVTVRGLLSGIQKCHGIMGAAISPEAEQFMLVLALPT
jgi:CheY-like chemotaxis protein